MRNEAKWNAKWSKHEMHAGLSLACSGSYWCRIYSIHIPHGGVSRLVKDYTPLIHGISPFKFGIKWAPYPLMLAAAVAPTPRCSMQHISRLSFTRALPLLEYPHLLWDYIWVIYNYIYMVVDQNSFMPERPFFANKNFRETFANSMFTFRGAHVGQQHLLWRFVHHLPNYARESRITSW